LDKPELRLLRVPSDPGMERVLRVHVDTKFSTLVTAVCTFIPCLHTCVYTCVHTSSRSTLYIACVHTHSYVYTSRDCDGKICPIRGIVTERSAEFYFLDRFFVFDLPESFARDYHVVY
jgi:hypothetical protein